MKILSMIMLLLCMSTGAAFSQTDSVKVKVQTTPLAEIGIDGDMSSNNMLSKVVAVGRHSVIVKYGADYEKTFDLDVTREGEHTYTFLIDGNLTVTSTPSAASVYIDGLEKGVTPLEIPMIGMHNLRVEKSPEVFYESTDRISINPFENVQRDYMLKKRPPRLYGMVMATWSENAYGGFLGICRTWGMYGRFAGHRLSDWDDGMWAGDYGDSGHSYDRYSSGSGLYEKDDHTYGVAVVGLMRRLNRSFYVYLGAGYGSYSVVMTPSSEYYEAGDEIQPYGVEGVVGDIGLIFKWKALLVSCGYSRIFGDAHPDDKACGDLYLGVGFTINNRKKR